MSPIISEIQFLEVYELPDVPGDGPCGVRKASKGRVKRGGQGGRRPMLVHGGDYQLK